MRKRFYSIAAVMFAGIGAAYAQAPASSTFNFTGGIQTFTVPCGVDTVFVQTWGAQGGAGAIGAPTPSQTGGTGGLGGYAEGWLVVNPGDVLNVFVGGQGATPTGGFNGGGNGGTQNAGGGGGASDVRVGGTAESNRVLTAGGGGGGGRGGCESTLGAGGNGGSGGGGVGVNGQNSPTSGGDAGGGFGGNAGSVQGAAGAAGIGCGGFLGSAGGTATTGTGANGGAGQSCCCFSFGSIPGGGGGGGGQLGGGGGGGGSAGTTGCSGNDKGAGGGGGGGSSYTGGVLNGTSNSGIWLGNGMVTISWTSPVPPAHTITGLSAMCEGFSTNYTINADPYSTFYTWTVPSGLTFNSGQNTTSINVTGTTPGTYMLYVQGVNGTCSLSGPIDSFAVVVNALPTVTMTSNASSACVSDSSVALSGSPAGGTYSGTGVVGAVFNPALAGAGSWSPVYTYTDGNSCTDSATVTIVVNALPVVTLTAPTLVCANDGPSTLAATPAGGTFSGPGVTGNTFNPAIAGVGAQTVTYSYTDAGTGCSNTASQVITVDACNSINAITEGSAILISPNPAVNVLNVTWGAKADVKVIRIMDASGKVVMSETINGGNRKEFDVTGLAAGNYSVSIEGTDSKSNFTFVKQ